MAEQLSYMMPDQSNQLSNEKKAIAELEDAVAERIFHLKDMSLTPSLDPSNNNYCPMEEVCHSLFSNIVRDEMTEQSDVEVIHSVSQLNAAQALALLGAEGTDG